MTDIGLPVLKPDRVISRIFERIGLIESEELTGSLYRANVTDDRHSYKESEISLTDFIGILYNNNMEDLIG